MTERVCERVNKVSGKGQGWMEGIEVCRRMGGTVAGCAPKAESTFGLGQDGDLRE